MTDAINAHKHDLEQDISVIKNCPICNYSDESRKLIKKALEKAKLNEQLYWEAEADKQRELSTMPEYIEY